MIIEDARTIRELTEIIKKNITRFKPSFEPVVGFQYKQVDRYSLGEQLEFFELLSKAGIVYRKPAQCVLTCQSCKSHNFSIRFACTMCRSPNISRGTLIKHDLCGNIDFDHNYVMLEGKMKCPKCNRALHATGVDYSKQTDFYKCLECKAVLHSIEKYYLCLQCGESFSENELDFQQLPTFQVDVLTLRTILNEGSPMPTVVEELARSGIKSSFSHSLVGRSQIAHLFDLVVYDCNNVPILVADILRYSNMNERKNIPAVNTDSMGEDEATLLLSFITKCADVSIKNKIIIAIPALNKRFRLLTDLNGISLIESQSTSSAISDILTGVTRVYGRAKSVPSQQ